MGFELTTPIPATYKISPENTSVNRIRQALLSIIYVFQNCLLLNNNSNLAQLNVDEYNIILNTKSKPTGTDFKTALKHHLQPFGHKYSPGTPGTNILIERLKRDARTNAILKEKPFKTSTPFTRRGRKNQTGTGVIKKNKKHNKSFVKFKPQLWTKN